MAPGKEPFESYEIRGIETRAEVLAVADLYGKAFANYPRLHSNYLDLLLRRMPRDQWRLSRTLWAPDGTPLAHVRIADRTMRLGSAVVRVGGVGDVCTDPFRRKRGMMRRVMSHCVEFMRDEGYPLSLLWGIPRFYDKFGFIAALSRDSLQLGRDQAARLDAPWRGRRARPADAAAVLRLFHDDLATRDGAMERWGDVWLRRVVREKLCRVLADGRGRPRAYYRAHPDGDALVLSEVSLGRRPDREAIASVLADMARVARSLEKPNLRLELPAEHPLGQFCVADGCETRRWIGHHGGGMVRITHLEALCRAMAPEWERCLAASPAAGWAGRLRLKTDMGTVDLAIARGKIEVVGGASLPRERSSGRAAAVVAADQDKLSRLVIGFHTPEAALLLGEVRITKEALPLATALFPPRALAIFPGDRF